MDGLPEHYYRRGERVLCFETESNAWHRARILDVTTSYTGEVMYLVRFDGRCENKWEIVTKDCLRRDYQTHSYDETGSDLDRWGFDVPSEPDAFVGGDPNTWEPDAPPEFDGGPTSCWTGYQPAATHSNEKPPELANVSASSNVTELWPIYKAYFNKNYEPVEDELRFNLFQKSVKEVVEHNELYARGEIGFGVAINKFSDWTSSELKKLRGRLNRN